MTDYAAQAAELEAQYMKAMEAPTTQHTMENMVDISLGTEAGLLSST